ncbi:MAG: hypothetical protein DCC71_09400 [Proteobacteria bacterium]|nr:MAG: hypothetical protein DCC71_09400 [Pseudomonadota bacterium]
MELLPFVRAACASLVLASVAPASAAELRARVSSATSIACSEAVCDCLDANQQPIACPATVVDQQDSGPSAVAVERTFENEIEAFFQALDGRTTTYVRTEGSAAFGTLHALAVAHADAGGEWVANGGSASPGEAEGSVTVEQRDTLTIQSPSPEAPVQLVFTQSVTTRGEAGVGAGSAVDPCDANAAAEARVSALLAVSSTSQQGGALEYERIVHSCNPPAVTGEPVATLPITVLGGEQVTLAQVLEAEVSARMDGGPFTDARVLDADAYVDGAETVFVFVRVVTPGASYTAESGTVYPTPEPGALASAAAALAALCAARRQRAGRT